MPFSNSKMEHQRGRNYSKSPSSPSSSKPSPSSSTNRQPFKSKINLSLNLKHTGKSSLSRTQANFLNISRPIKYPRMSSSSAPSKKHTHDDEPFQPILWTPTGLEEILDIPAKKPRLLVTRPETEMYLQRQKITKYAAMIRKKKALAKNISNSSSRMPISAQRGMTNPNSLCYRISLLQALFHQPKFVNWLLDSHLPQDCVSDTEEECLPCALRHLILGYWNGTEPHGEFQTVFRGMGGLFKFLGWSADSSNGHADPDEQAAWIFSAMRTVMPSSTFASLESVMQLVTTSAIRCKCGHESRTEGHSDRTLPLAITPKIQNGTLAQYLHRYMVEVVEGYKCEKCKDESKKHRVQLIGYAPDILAIQLKRFRWDGAKDSSLVGINTILDLDRYRDTNNHDRLRYELTAVIKHGGGARFGHYICCAKGPDGAWYDFNDISVSRTSIMEATSAKSGFTPYLMFFQRKET